MLNKISCATVLIGLAFCSVQQLAAQEIVHALCGTVSSVNSANKTMTVFQDGGSTASFKVMSASSTRLEFDKKIAEETTVAKNFDKQGEYSIVFYFGLEDNRTAVAVKDLGAGPFSSTTGEVTKWDGHDHTLSVKDKSNAVHSFKVDPQTVAETYQGAVNGSRFDASNGDRVRVVSSAKNGAQTALFIQEQ